VDRISSDRDILEMIILLNGPLGVGKSTLAEALTGRIDDCVMLDGDALVAVNPPPDDELEHLHSTMALLVAHHRRFGYRHFVIDHLWTSPAELDDLRERLREVDPKTGIHCFRLTLPRPENIARIERRASVRALDELAFERRTVAEERELLARHAGDALGEPFDVSDSPSELVARLLERIERETAP
jgi:hypothetical protein